MSNTDILNLHGSGHIIRHRRLVPGERAHSNRGNDHQGGGAHVKKKIEANWGGNGGKGWGGEARSRASVQNPDVQKKWPSHTPVKRARDLASGQKKIILLIEISVARCLGGVNYTPPPP